METGKFSSIWKGAVQPDGCTIDINFHLSRPAGRLTYYIEQSVQPPGWVALMGFNSI